MDSLTSRGENHPRANYEIMKNERFCTDMHFHDGFANLNYVATFSWPIL